MREKHRLRMLHMRTPRHDGTACGLRLLAQRVRERKHLVRDNTRVTAQPHADECRDLVVAGTSRAQLAAEFVPCDADESTFERGRLVLVVLDRREHTAVHTALQFVEGGFHTLQFVGSEQACAPECACVSARTGDVIVGESPVELCGLAQQREFR